MVLMLVDNEGMVISSNKKGIAGQTNSDLAVGGALCKAANLKPVSYTHLGRFRIVAKLGNDCNGGAEDFSAAGCRIFDLSLIHI